MTRVLSRQDLLSEIRKNPRQLNCVIIVEPASEFGYRTEPAAAWWSGLSKTTLSRMQRYPKEKIIVRFWDIEDEPERLEGPQEHHVKAVLDWAKDREVDIVACHAGISRSSALAILIECQKIFAGRPVTVKEAIISLKLHHNFHRPNRLILKHGAKILGRPEIPHEVAYWKKGGNFIPLIGAV